MALNQRHELEMDPASIPGLVERFELQLPGEHSRVETHPTCRVIDSATCATTSSVGGTYQCANQARFAAPTLNLS